MKKLFKWLTMCLVIVLAMFTFAACTDPDKGGDGGNDGGSGGGSETTTSYTITYTNGAGYTLSGAASAEEPVAGPAVRGPSEVPRWGTL